MNKNIFGAALALSAGSVMLSATDLTESEETGFLSSLLRSLQKITSHEEELSEAIHKNAHRLETWEGKKHIVKYIHFPKWMPVDSNGCFDMHQAKRIVKGFNIEKNKEAILTYFNSVQSGTSHNKAYNQFLNDISVKNPASRKHLENTLKQCDPNNAEWEMSPRSWGWLLATALTIIFTSGLKATNKSDRAMYAYTDDGNRYLEGYKPSSKAEKITLKILYATSLFFAYKCGVSIYKDATQVSTQSMETMFLQATYDMYNEYVDQTIKTHQNQQNTSINQPLNDKIEEVEYNPSQMPNQEVLGAVLDYIISYKSRTGEDLDEKTISQLMDIAKKHPDALLNLIKNNNKKIYQLSKMKGHER